jgi:drug/metabolite transporter (DMT)-like permease
MLYIGMLGIILGTAFGHHFTAANITAAALAASAWMWAVGSVAAQGLFRAAYGALFLTWSLEAGLLAGLILYCLFFHRRARTGVVEHAATTLPRPPPARR